MLPSPNSCTLRGLIRPRWITLLAVQCIMLWLIPKTGDDFPQSRPACENFAFASCAHSSSMLQLQHGPVLEVPGEAVYRLALPSAFAQASRPVDLHLLVYTHLAGGTETLARDSA